MIKKEITYKDLDDNDVTETFWFNLSQAEMAEMAIGKEGKQGGFETWVKTLIESQDGEVLVETFKKILLSTIGERSADNKRFVKTEEIRNNFLWSNAYSVLFMDLMTDAEKMSEFINGIVPANMRDDLAKRMANSPAGSALASTPAASAQASAAALSAPIPTPVSEQKDDRPDWIKDPNRIPTERELIGATHEQMMEAFRRKTAGSGPVTQEEITGQS